MEDKKPEEGQSEPVYGGCEGPNAMYVKLISSDGHEFIINRDYALTSGTIKAMLSGPGQKLTKTLLLLLNKFILGLVEWSLNSTIQWINRYLADEF